MCTNRVLMKAFIESQFGYYLLIWMFHSRGVNNKIKVTNRKVNLHELPIKTTLVLSKIYLKGISRFLFIKGTFNY